MLAGKQPGVPATLVKANVCRAPTTVTVVVTDTSMVYVVVSGSKSKNLSPTDGSTTAVGVVPDGLEGMIVSGFMSVANWLLTTVTSEAQSTLASGLPSSVSS